MKKSLRLGLFTLCAALTLTNTSYGQTDCPVASAPCVKSCGNDNFTVSVTIMNNTGKKESLNIRCDEGCVNQCITIEQGTRTYSYGPFHCASLPHIHITIYKHKNCEGDTCVSYTLPVTIKSFNVKRSGQSVSLTWTTASEQNNSGFAIERSTKQDVWNDVAWMQSGAPNGTSSTDINYTYSDVQPTDSSALYRIKQIDQDGRFTYSWDIAVPALNQAGVKVSPNPIVGNGYTNVTFPLGSFRDAYLIDLMGHQIQKWTSITSTSIHIEHLPASGIYILGLTDQFGKVTTQKIEQR